MTEADWDKWLSENTGNDGNYIHYDAPANPANEDQEFQDAQEIKIKGIKRESEKAIFYVTQNEFETEDGSIIGMWIPKSGILSVDKDTVFVKEWCTLTEVEWEGN